MPTKPLNRWAGKLQSDAAKVNHNDRDAKGPIVQDGLSESDPNAMGRAMRPVYDATASAASHWADQHDANPEDVPYPRVQPDSAAAEGSRSARFRGRTGDDERTGPAGKFDQSDNPYAGKKAGKTPNDGDNRNALPGKRFVGSK
jgi:hypothetical protein